MSCSRRGRHTRDHNSDSDSIFSDEVKFCDRNKRSHYTRGNNFLNCFLNQIRCICLMKNSCLCLILYPMFGCLMLAFLYFYGATLVLQISRLIRIILQFILPASWLQSTRDIVEEALAKYNADRLGLADYALESVGGSVLCSSETYFAKSGPMYSVFGIPLWYHSSSPREVIQPDVQPGKCWAMDGSHGYVMIKLAMPVIVSAISLEHIPMEVAPSGRLDSAPRDFVIIGKERSMDSPDIVLGKFTYHIGKDPIQVFEIKDPFCVTKSDVGGCSRNNKVFSIITLKILTNHGNHDFTCIYRLRVHGQPLTTVPAEWAQ